MRQGGILYGVSAAALALVLGLQQPADAEIRALLVGADAYHVKGINDLQGPRNDVSAVEQLLRREGATDVTVLTDDQVTRTKVETAFHALGLRARPGDWVVLLYAGHGAQAAAAVKGIKKNDLDDFLVLPGIDLVRPGPETYILSADLRSWLLNYIPASVTVVQMVDACHSGTLERKIDPRAPRFRTRLAFQTRGGPEALKLTARPAPQFAALPNSIRTSLGASDPQYLPNVVYISAAQDEQFAQEAALPEAKSPAHGVLTYNFLAAMEGVEPDGKTLVADSNHDGVVTIGELSVYLDSQTRAMTDEEQEPSIHFDSRFQDRALFTQPAVPGGRAAPPPVPAVFVADPRGAALLAGGAGWSVAARRDDADYVWDYPSGDVMRRTGDVVAHGVADLPALQGVLEKWTTVETLRPFLREAAAHVAVGPGRNGVRYAPGAHVELSISPAPLVAAAGAPATPPYVTVFDLASDGRVQTLYPLAQDGEGRMPGGSALPVLTTEVVEPYGADHVVALLTPYRPDDFRTLLRTVEGSRGSGRLVSAVEREITRSGPGGGLSINAVYTGPER